MRVTTLISCSLLLGCANDAPAPSQQNAEDAAVEASPDYGTTPGKTLADFEIAGYVRWADTGRATESPFGRFKFYEFRTQKPDARYALIHTAGVWCKTCVGAAKEIVAAWPELSKKAIFVELLTEGSSPTVPATKANLDLWIDYTSMPFTAGIDPNGTIELRTRLGVEDMSYIVELSTMRIVDRTVDYRSLLAKLRAL